jgi:hypothetical protein
MGMRKQFKKKIGRVDVSKEKGGLYALSWSGTIKLYLHSLS